jgi:hypothetical protein
MTKSRFGTLHGPERRAPQHVRDLRELRSDPALRDGYAADAPLVTLGPRALTALGAQ